MQPASGMSAYCCSKSALAMLANVAAMELGPSGIRVNAIAPGLVKTGLTEGMWLIPSIVDEFIENAPLGTHPTAEDVADLVAFLASDESRAHLGLPPPGRRRRPHQALPRHHEASGGALAQP